LFTFLPLNAFEIKS